MLSGSDHVHCMEPWCRQSEVINRGRRCLMCCMRYSGVSSPRLVVQLLLHYQIELRYLLVVLGTLLGIGICCCNRVLILGVLPLLLSLHKPEHRELIVFRDLYVVCDLYFLSPRACNLVDSKMLSTHPSIKIPFELSSRMASKYQVLCMSIQHHKKSTSITSKLYNRQMQVDMISYPVWDSF